jgi:hypothetical protein
LCPILAAGPAAAVFGALPQAVAHAPAGADPIGCAFTEHEHAKAAADLAWKASEDLTEIAVAALKSAGLNPRDVWTGRQLWDRYELGLCSTADYEAGLAALERLRTEHQKMLTAVEESEDAAQEASEVAGSTERALFETAPTSRAGALRLLRFIADFLDEDDVVNDTWVGDVVGEAIRNAIAVFESEALS